MMLLIHSKVVSISGRSDIAPYPVSEEDLKCHRIHEKIVTEAVGFLARQFEASNLPNILGPIQVAYKASGFSDVTDYIQTVFKPHILRQFNSTIQKEVETQSRDLNIIDSQQISAMAFSISSEVTGHVNAALDRLCLAVNRPPSQL